MFRKLKFSKGFTLLELLVVVAIIGILSTVIIVSISSARAKARDSRRMSDIKQIEKALILVADSNGGTFPSTPSAAKCLGFAEGEACWNSSYMKGSQTINDMLTPYLPQIPRDPLTGSRGKGNAYLYAGSDKTVAWHCDGTDPLNYRPGPYLIWFPEKSFKSNSDDSACGNLGFSACCGTAPQACDGLYCAYKL